MKTNASNLLIDLRQSVRVLRHFISILLSLFLLPSWHCGAFLTFVGLFKDAKGNFGGLCK